MKKLSFLVFAIASLLGCTAIEPGSCYPNPAGGTGDTDPMPIGAGVGVSASGDYATDPPKGPLDTGDGVGGGWGAPPRQPQDVPPNPCNPPDAEKAGTYIRCRGLDPMTCEEMCFDIGAVCAGLKTHPYGSKGGIGRLKQCQRSTPGTTCTYCYENGDVCTFVKAAGVKIWEGCSYTGGKGCE